MRTVYGRPKVLPPPTMGDLLIEAGALVGLMLNIAIIVYGVLSLPEIIPAHIGPSGGIDSYGSKWILLTIFFVVSITCYVLLTVLNKYPYWFSYPAVVTDENALPLYRLGRGVLRWLKLILLWMFAAIAFLFIVVLPYNPGQSGLTPAIVAPFMLLIIIVLIYHLVMMIRAGKTD